MLAPARTGLSASRCCICPAAKLAGGLSMTSVGMPPMLSGSLAPSDSIQFGTLRTT